MRSPGTKSVRSRASWPRVAARGKSTRPPGNHLVTSGPMKVPPACWRAWTSASVARRSGSISRRVCGAQVVAGEIELVALGINHDLDPPEDAFGLGLGGEAFDAADAQEFDGARQLPALRQGNRQAHAVVGPRPKADGQALDLRAVELRLPQGLLYQAERVGRRGRRSRWPRPDRAARRRARHAPRPRCVAARRTQAPGSS